MQVNHDQPFYGVLPDEHDCTRLFRGVRTSKYVAQVNAPPTPPPPLASATIQLEQLRE